MICMCILHLLAFLVTSTKLDEPYEEMYFVQIDKNGNIINKTYEHDKDRVEKSTKVFRGGNIYYLDTRRKKFKMSKLERGEAIKHLYEKYKQELKPSKTTDLFDQVREWNKKHGFTISKGTCDRRNRKVCKNACRKVYRRICNEIKCKSVFKEEIKKNCAKICNLEFKQEFG